MATRPSRDGGSGAPTQGIVNPRDYVPGFANTPELIENQGNIAGLPYKGDPVGQQGGS